MTQKSSIKVILIVICSILLLAFGYSNSPPSTEIVSINTEEPWKPSEEDIAYQDSMYCIIEQTQLDIEEIKIDINGIVYKLDRLYYDDGSWDSIRYVEGEKIDKALIINKQ